MVYLWWMFAGAALTAVYFILTQRRHTPELVYSPATLPRLEDGLRVIAGLTRAAVQSRNSVTVIQNGAFFDALEADIRAARYTVHIESFVWTRGALRYACGRGNCRFARGVTLVTYTPLKSNA